MIDAPLNLIPVLSTLAIVLGLAGVLPHIAAMVRRRSAAGQSALGWSLGVTVNALMAYVNTAGYGAETLALGNGFGCALCAIALGCALLLPRAEAPAAASPGVRDAELVEVPTGDLAEMLDAISRERVRREERRRAAERPEACIA